MKEIQHLGNGIYLKCGIKEKLRVQTQPLNGFINNLKHNLILN